MRRAGILGLSLVALIVLVGCNESGPSAKIGGKPKEGTPIGHWMSSSPTLEVVFHESGELTWMETSEEAGSWRQIGSDTVEITRQNGSQQMKFSQSGSSLTLTPAEGTAITLKRQ